MPGLEARAVEAPPDVACDAVEHLTTHRAHQPALALHDESGEPVTVPAPRTLGDIVIVESVGRARDRGVLMAGPTFPTAGTPGKMP